MQDGSIGDICLSVSLGMVDQRETVLDSKLGTEVSELYVIKLASIVDDEYEWDIDLDNDIFLNKLLHLGFDDHGQWISFHPLGEVVNGHDEEPSLFHHHGERAEDVNPLLGEGPRCGNGCQRY